MTQNFIVFPETCATIIHHGWLKESRRVAEVEIDRNKPATEELERLFAEWNAGSGRESRQFIESGVRSLSVGDVVRFGANGRKGIENEYWLCDSVGWRKITAREHMIWRNVHPCMKTSFAGDVLDEVLASGCCMAGAIARYFTANDESYAARESAHRQHMASVSLAHREDEKGKTEDELKAERWTKWNESLLANGMNPHPEYVEEMDRPW